MPSLWQAGSAASSPADSDSLEQFRPVPISLNSLEPQAIPLAIQIGMDMDDAGAGGESRPIVVCDNSGHQEFVAVPPKMYQLILALLAVAADESRYLERVRRNEEILTKERSPRPLSDIL